MKTHLSAPPLSLFEFVALMALLSSITAFSIDAMLPALPQIAKDLAVANPNQVQLIIAVMMLGLSIGQLFYGPFCDSKGRKPTLYLGMSIFFVGSILCLSATNLLTMIIGRFIQGFGLGATRVVSAALIRDTYSGPQMSRIMSLIMVMFIWVPMVAPLIGQFIISFATWPMIFIVIASFALIGIVWFAIRQQETLSSSHQKPFTLLEVRKAFQEVLTHKVVMACTLAQGLVMGAFLAYLVASQAIFERTYGIVDNFPLYFAILALAFGVGSFANSSLVVRHGMKKMVSFSLPVFVIFSLLLLILSLAYKGNPPFYAFMGLTIPIFLAVNVMFTNFNAMAMQLLGHIAGVGAAVVGSVSTVLGVACSVIIGQQFTGTLTYFYGSYMAMAFFLFFLVKYIMDNFQEPAQ
ncbi:MAG: multidrug effflux MFS transporter [Pseudomonadota bacterium]